jgi:hypothetical protein
MNCWRTLCMEIHCEKGISHMIMVAKSSQGVKGVLSEL